MIVEFFLGNWNIKVVGVVDVLKVVNVFGLKFIVVENRVMNNFVFILFKFDDY